VSTELFKLFTLIHTQSLGFNVANEYIRPADTPRASTPALEAPDIASTSANAPTNVANQTASSEGPDGSANPPTANDDDSNNSPGAATSSIPPANHELPPNSAGLNARSAEGEQDIQGTSNIEQQQPPYVDQAKMRAKNQGRKRKTKQKVAVPLVEATSMNAIVEGPMPTEPTPMEPTPATLPGKKNGNRRNPKKRTADEAALEPIDGTRKSSRLRRGAPPEQ
jgi:hypothetical protein